jgi:hypothetical protein
LEIAVVGSGGRWWGGVDEVTAVVGLRVGLRKPGLLVLGQKPETGPLGLGLGRAVGNGSGVRWGEEVAWCRRGGGGGAYVQSSTREREGAGAKKTRNPSHSGSVSVRIRAAAGGGGFCSITGPPLWYPRWWLVDSKMVWLLLLTFGTCIPSCLYISSPPFSILLPQPLFPSQGPMDGLGTVRGASRSVVVEWSLSGRQRDAPCRVWRSFKLRRFSIAIAI